MNLWPKKTADITVEQVVKASHEEILDLLKILEGSGPVEENVYFHINIKLLTFKVAALEAHPALREYDYKKEMRDTIRRRQKGAQS